MQKNLKKLLIASFVFLFAISIANAHIANAESNNSSTTIQNNEVQKNEKEHTVKKHHTTVKHKKQVWKEHNSNFKLFLLQNGSTTTEAQIKSLREDYLTKLKALQQQYFSDLKNIVGTSTPAFIKNNS